MNLSLGYACIDITPSLDAPVYLAGFGQNRQAQSVHDPLYARALVLSESGNLLALCALDLIGLFRSDIYEVIRQFQKSYPHAHVIVASTHTHHGPDTMGLWGPDMKTTGVNPIYLAELKGKISSVLREAARDLQPARFKAVSRQVTGLVKNARDPEIIDDELTLAQWIAVETGKPLATLFNFPCHPEVLWDQNPNITSDYPAALREAVEQATGAPCIFFSGGLGGMLSPDVLDHSFEEASSMGQRLAREGLAALEVVSSQPIQDFRIQQQEIHVRLTNPLFWAARLRRLLPFKGSSRTGWMTTEVNLVQIGELWLATVPGEILPKLGLALKSSMQEAGAGVVGIIGLANDELGYILPEGDFHYPLNPLNPGNHYEETMSVSRKIGPLVVKTLQELINKLV